MKAENTWVEEKEKITNFREVYQNYNSFVRASLFWMVGSEPLDDLVQETFVKIWKSHSKFKGKAQLKTWIYRIAMNTAKDYSRKRGRYQAFLNESGFLKTQNQPDLELAQGIEKCILQLDIRKREAFVLYYKMELTIEEVAKSLDIPEGTVKSRLHKGRDEFIKNLKKLGFEYDG